VKKMTGISPIKEPNKIYAGQELFIIAVSKVNKSKTFPASAIGDQLFFAGIKPLKVKSVDLNEGETGVVINRTTDNIRISFDSSSNPSEGDGAVFDEEKKANAVATSINIVNREKAKSLRDEIDGALSFYDEMIKEGA